MPYLKPSIQLLFKAKYPRSKDITDFNTVLAVLPSGSGAVSQRKCAKTIRGPRGVGWGPLMVGLCSAVSYSPTPWRVQYHRRWRA